MKTLEQVIADYEKKLTEIYARANTKSKRKRIVHDLLNFSNICQNHFDIDKEFEWEKDLNIITLLKNYRVPFIYYIVNNYKLYNDIFSSVFNTYIESDYDIYKYYSKTYQKLTEKEIQELIVDFLNSYDEKLANEFLNKLDNYEMFHGKSVGYTGNTYPISCLNKNLIFCTSPDWASIVGAATRVHEYGHSYEMKIFNSVGKDDYLDKAYTSPYYEVFSRFFEYAFISYLKENKIIVDDANKYFDTLTFDLLTRAYNTILICKLKELRIEELDNIYITDDNIVNTAREMQEKINYYSLPSEKGDIIEFRKSFIYGIGDIFSIYMYENYKEDPNNFKKEFVNAILNYHYSGIKAFERVGITEEKLIKGDTLKRVLKTRVLCQIVWVNKNSL